MPGKKYASIKNPRVYEALRRQGMSKTRAARISNAQRHKDAGTVAGAMLGGPGGLLATPGMGGRKWGNRGKHKACTCGVVTKESLGPGITRIRGNLCNVHGRYGRCPGSGAPTPKKGKKPRVTPEQRAQDNAALRVEKRDQVLADMGLDPGAAEALSMLRNGEQPQPEALARAGAVEAGLVERAADGSYRMTPSGRALMAAAEAGDPGRAGDIISAARDRKAARTAKEREAAQKKLDAAAKRAEAAAAKKPAKGGGGGSSDSGDVMDTRAVERQQREQERQEDRKRREEERQADRAKRQAEHDEDRAQRLRERSEDRQARLDERRARQRPASVARSRTPIVMPSRRRRPNAVRAKSITTKALRVVEHGGDTIQGNSTIHEAYGHARTYGEISQQWLGMLLDRDWAYATDNGYALREPGEIVAKEPTFQAQLDDIRARNRPDLKSFAVFKSADGSYRWIARSTTAYRDRDGEIITTKALDADAARMTSTGQYGPLRYWHIGQPDPFDPAAPWGPGLDIGECDYSVLIGRTSIESGTFETAAIGEAFAASAADYELSPGFFHPPDQPDAAGEYHAIRRFERSVVPIAYGRASNLFTGLTVKEHRMDQQTYEARVKAFLADMHGKGVPPEVAAQSLASMEQADKSATAQGVAFKSDDAPADPWQAVIAALKAAVQPAVVNNTIVAEKADMAPASMEQAGETEIEDAMEEQADDGEPGGEYIGDLTPSEFWAQLQQLLAPVLKMQDMVKAMTDMGGELKAMYATKDAGANAEIAALKAQQAEIAAQLARLMGDQPISVIPADVEAALKGAPQPPAEPDALDVPDRPAAALTAALFPSLYGGAVQGYNGADGWRIGQPLPPANTGGN